MTNNFCIPAKKRAGIKDESIFSTMLSPFSPAIWGLQPSEVDLKDLAKAVAAMEQYLIKVGTSSNLQETWSHDVNRSLQGVEGQVDRFLWQLGSKPGDLPTVQETPSLWGVILSIATNSGMDSLLSMDADALSELVQNTLDLWSKECKKALSQNDQHLIRWSQIWAAVASAW
jgi:hypothetical protein